eukprot:COSAG06_NODE_36878_length_441_cov_9.824561_1_plen_81_part_10
MTRERRERRERREMREGKLLIDWIARDYSYCTCVGMRSKRCLSNVNVSPPFMMREMIHSIYSILSVSQSGDLRLACHESLA